MNKTGEGAGNQEFLLIMLILKCLYIHASRRRCQDKWLDNKSQPRAKVETNVKQYGVIKFQTGLLEWVALIILKRKISGNEEVRLLDCPSEQNVNQMESGQKKTVKGKSEIYMPILV